MDNKEFKVLLELAKRCVVQTGKLLRKQGDNLLTVHERKGHDIKLEADRAAERLIRSKLEKTGIPIIGEEYGGDESLMQSDQLYWAVDPLDGTVNYSFGIPFSCSSVGLWRGMTPIIGAVYDFWRDELFYGAEGQGAFLNKKLIKVPVGIANKKDAMTTAAWPPPTIPNEMACLIAQYRQFRNFGSCALSLAYLACGRIGAFYEKVYIWDIAAALAIIKAAGGAMVLKPVGGYRVEVSAAWNKELLPRI